MREGDSEDFAAIVYNDGRFIFFSHPEKGVINNKKVRPRTLVFSTTKGQNLKGGDGDFLYELRNTKTEIYVKKGGSITGPTKIGTFAAEQNIKAITKIKEQGPNFGLKLTVEEKFRGLFLTPLRLVVYVAYPKIKIVIYFSPGFFPQRALGLH